MDRWSPVVASRYLYGRGPGARRICVINEKRLDEAIATVDDKARLFQYRIEKQELMLVTNVLGSIHIAPISSDCSQVQWFINLEVLDEAVWPQVKAGIESIYVSSTDSLAALAAAYR